MQENNAAEAMSMLDLMNIQKILQKYDQYQFAWFTGLLVHWFSGSLDTIYFADSFNL